MSANLYQKLLVACDSHVSKLVSKLLNQTSDPSGYLTLVNNQWQQHCRQTVKGKKKKKLNFN